MKLTALALLPGLALLAAAVQGQAPAGAQGPKKVYTQKTNFKLPVHIDDTKPPEVAIRKMTAISGDVYLQCEVQDANLDASKTKMEYLAKDQTWKPLDAMPEQPGIFRMPDPDQCHGLVRATAGDRANNMNYCEMNLLTNET